MLFFNRLIAVLLTTALIGSTLPLEARTRKGDKYLAEGRTREQKKDWDPALEAYEKALSEDPADILYQMAVDKARFQAGQAHIDRGMKLRSQGQLGEALLEFQKGYGINPGSAVATQELVRTQEMIQRERKRAEENGKASPPEVRALTPAEEMKKETEEKINRILPVPELKPLNPEPIRLKMNNQPPKVLFETVAKMAGINVLWDPEMNPPPTGNPKSVEFDNSTLDEALDYLGVLTKSYWKPLSPNTIFVTNDNPNKRRDYEEQVTKIFYLSNVNTPQELQEIVNAARTVAEMSRMFPYNSQNAIVVRGEADRVALVEKIIHDLDKPKSEVVVDIIVMETSSVYTRQLTAAIASAGLNVPIAFTPRSGLKVVNNANTTNTTTTPTTTTTTPTTTTPTTTTTGTNSNAIPLSSLGHLSSADFSTIVPDALLQAVMSDAKTKVMQSPQLRSVDNVKASLKIGDRQPTATGSFQPGIGGVGINPLVNTQFTYIDVGVNVDVTPRVHDNGEVSMHVELDISSVTGHVNLGGIDQPIIGQRKVTHDIRMRDGEINLLGGLIKQQDTKSVSGVPGLSSIPLLRRLFTSENVDRERSELMIALIPHIVRRPDITPENLRTVAVGNATTIKLNYAPRPAETAPAQPAPAAPAATPGAPPATAPAAPKPEPPAPAQNPIVTPGAIAPPATAPPAGASPATAAPQPAAPTAPAATPPAGAPRIHFQPSQADVDLSGNLTVNLVVEEAYDVASAPMQIRFDPKILRLNDVAVGGFLSGDGQQTVFTKNILNDAGIATVQLNRSPSSAGSSGSGVLVTLIFQAVGRGPTSVGIPNLALRSSQGIVITTQSPQLTVNVK